MDSPQPKVLVIGAGPAGLLNARHLKDVCDLKVLEAQSQIGGIWNYNKFSEFNHPNLKNDVFFRHTGWLFSSMYDDLILNLPSKVMENKDFPLEKDTPNFMTRHRYLQYLLSYAEHFNLQKYIQFDTFVLSVRLVSGLSEAEMAEWKVSGQKRFAVQYCSSSDQSKIGYDEADYVLVSNGHNSVPIIPKIEGEEEYEGERMAFHSFRNFQSADFKGKTILLIGFGASSLDFILHMIYNEVLPQEYFGTVYFAGRMFEVRNSRDFKAWLDSGKLILKDGYVKKLGKGKKVTFGDDTVAEVDMIWYTCGYSYSFPFLKNSPDKLIDWSLSQDDGNFWGPLYHRTFCVNEPHLMFTGNHDLTYMLRYLSEVQSMVVSKFVQGQLVLPGKDEMMTEWNKEVETEEARGRPLRSFYNLEVNVDDWDQLKKLRKLGNSEGSEELDKAFFDFGTFIFAHYLRGEFRTFRDAEKKDLPSLDIPNTSAFF